MSQAKPQTAAMRPGVREAHDRLTRALVAIAARGLRTHCSDVELHSYWLSDDQQEREVAARLCRGCPVLSPCGDVGQYEHFGVFGGVDRSPRPYKINSDQDQMGGRA